GAAVRLMFTGATGLEPALESRSRSGSEAADVLERGLDRLARFSSGARCALDEIANLPYRHREHREVVCVSGLDVGQYLQTPLDGLGIVRDPGADALRDGAVPRFAQHLGGERALLVVEVLPQSAAGEHVPALLTGEPGDALAKRVELQPVADLEIESRD